jgi:hypothetical protein
MKETIRRVIKKDMESKFGDKGNGEVTFMKETGNKTKWMEKECINIRMEMCMKESGKTI